MRENAADGILMQCGGKYGFSEDNSLGATDITTLNIKDLKLLPSNNLKDVPSNSLKDERKLVENDQRVSNVAKCRNFKLIHNVE